MELIILIDTTNLLRDLTKILQRTACARVRSNTHRPSAMEANVNTAPVLLRQPVRAKEVLLLHLLLEIECSPESF